jgi:hypothetical protein
MIIVDKIKEYLNGDLSAETLVKAVQLYNSEPENNVKVEVRSLASKNGKASTRVIIEDENFKSADLQEFSSLGFKPARLVLEREYEEGF